MVKQTIKFVFRRNFNREYFITVITVLHWNYKEKVLALDMLKAQHCLVQL